MHKSTSRWIYQNKNCGGLLEIWEQLEEIISSDVFVVKVQINFVTFWLNSLTKFCVKVCVWLQRKFFFFLLSEQSCNGLHPLKQSSDKFPTDKMYFVADISL